MKRSFCRIFIYVPLVVFAGFLVQTGIYASANEIRVRSVGPVGLTVSDLDRMVSFFTKVLAFHKVTEFEVSGEAYDRLRGLSEVRMRIARLRLGGEEIELTEFLHPQGRPIPKDSRSNDRWFQHIAIIVSDMERAYQRLKRHEVKHISPRPQRLPDWNPHAGGIKAFYFRSPDGHPLEILEFPRGKGAPRWHRPTKKLFLGIDHTAIVVGSTDASLKFYRDILGLRVTGISQNHGPEQEKLNNVVGARLRITGLRASRGPGIEFLEYQTPRNGRPMPSDVKSNDLMHWQTTLVVKNILGIVKTLRGTADRFVSRKWIEVPDQKMGFRKAVVIRDPDGHAVRLVEK